jgi:acyl-CoA reductase-like NAD-dependent aldehyde dehydrogenase
MDIGLLINGDEIAAASGTTFERNDPFTGKVATRAPAGGVADAKAAAAFPGLRQITIEDPPRRHLFRTG